MGVSTRTRAVRTRPATEEPTAINASVRQSLSTPPRKYAPAAPILRPRAAPLQAGEEAAGGDGEKAHVMASWKTVPMAPRISVVQSSVW